jgi:hypothetical protein
MILIFNFKQERETKMDEFNWTYYHNVNGDVIKVFFPFEAVISSVGGIFRGSRVIPTTDFDEHYDAVLICPGNDLIFLTTKWWQVIEGNDVSIYHVEGMAVMQSSQPFIIRPVNWPEKAGWSFRIGYKEGVDTGWCKI